MTKTALSIKLDEAERDDLRRIAGQRNKTVTAVIVDGIKAEVTRLQREMQKMRAAFDARLDSVQREMRDKYEAATGVRKKIVLRRRVPIRLSESEHQILEQAHRQDLSGAELARRVLISQMPALHGHETPALESVAG